jgi:hypothetical protein
VCSYISEPDRGRRIWKDDPEARDAVYRNRRRIRGDANACSHSEASGWNRRLRIFYETGRMRRVHLRGHTNIRKRVLHTAASNLGLLMRTLFGVGTPRSLQGPLPTTTRSSSTSSCLAPTAPKCAAVARVGSRWTATMSPGCGIRTARVAAARALLDMLLLPECNA